MVWYRLTWNQPVSGDSIALTMDYLNMAGAVYLNGSLLSRDSNLVEPLTRAWNTPHYWLATAPILLAGTNSLLIRVSGLSAYQPGLGTITIGDPTTMRVRYEREYWLRHDLQLFSLAVTATLGCFFIILWLMRRRETAFGWFGLMSLAWLYVAINQIATTPWPFNGNDDWEAANTIAFLIYSACFTMFTLRFCERRFRRSEWVLWLAVIGGSLIMASTPHRQMQLARGILTLLPALSYFGSCFLFLYFSWRSRRADQLILSGCIGIFLLVGLHDLLVFLKIFDSNIYYSSLASQIQMVSMAAVLGWRFVANLRRIEGFNDELTQKVSAAKNELAATLRRQHELEVVNVRFGERLNFAHDLHDGLGGVLVSSIAALEHAPASISAERFLAILKELRDDLRIIIDAASSHQIEETSLADMIAPLRYRLPHLFESHRIACRWNMSGIDRCYLAASASLDFLRILQEGLTNTLKHSEATRVDIELCADGKSISLSIKDNGVGFDLQEIEQRAGTGMRSMRTRANRLGGVFQIQRIDGETMLSVQVPYTDS